MISDVGFTDGARLLGIRCETTGTVGYPPDLSNGIIDRAMFHAGTAYFLGNAQITGHRCKTHLASNTAYRGFGGPQGMLAIENVMDAIARHRGLDPLEVRRRNYYGKETRHVTHYHQVVEDNLLEEMTADLAASSDYQARREAIQAFNRANPLLRKGHALSV